jgi:hypothetical protein
MAELIHLQFQCAKCNESVYVPVEDEEDPEINELWPLGWIWIVSRAVGLNTEIEVCYCTLCRGPVLTVLGYSSYKEYVSVVQAHAKIEAALKRKEALEEQSNKAFSMYFFADDFDDFN